MAGITTGSWLQPCINNMDLEGVERGDGEITSVTKKKTKKRMREGQIRTRRELLDTQEDVVLKRITSQRETQHSFLQIPKPDNYIYFLEHLAN